MGQPQAVISTDLPLPGKRTGKVRDVYDLPAGVTGLADETGARAGGSGGALLLFVASDRLSAFDVVLPTPIPGKGALLTRMAASWFDWIADHGLCPTHVLASEPQSVRRVLERALPASTDAHQLDNLAQRSMVVRACEIVPIECVVRGYLEGSGWSEYTESGTVCGVACPPGLRRGDRLPAPIFTPATKAEFGAHDENITFDRACDIAGGEVMEHLRDVSVRIYDAAHEYALERGVILADTKFEFGVLPTANDAASDAPGDGSGGCIRSDQPFDPARVVIADEALTPDSSRYWPKDDWSPGGPQPSFDKQYVREYLEGLVSKGEWEKSAPGPALPDQIAHGTQQRYAEAYELLFG